MAILEIMTNCGLRKRNPNNCLGGSFSVTYVEQRKCSAVGTRINKKGKE